MSVSRKRRRHFQYVNPDLCTVEVYAIPSKMQLAMSWVADKVSEGVVFQSSNGPLVGHVTMLDAADSAMLKLEFVTHDDEIWQVKWQVDTGIGEAYSPTLYQKLAAGV